MLVGSTALDFRSGAVVHVARPDDDAHVDPEPTLSLRDLRWPSSNNRTVNLLNIHTAISMVALAGGGAFYSAYLLTAGVSVPVVLLANSAIFAVRLVLRQRAVTWHGGAARLLKRLLFILVRRLC